MRGSEWKLSPTIEPLRPWRAPDRPTFDKEPPDHDDHGAIRNDQLELGGWTIVTDAGRDACDHEDGEREPKPFGQEYAGDPGINHAQITLVWKSPDAPNTQTQVPIYGNCI